MPEALKKLISSINYLPWIWEKSATKLAFFLLNSNTNYIENLKNNLSAIKEKISKCNICWSLCDISKEKCNICLNTSRSESIIMIVEEYLDMLTIEQSGSFNWKYHILWWAISPINWVFVWDLNIKWLFDRIESSNDKVEIILATNPNIEWEATSSYIKKKIKIQSKNNKIKQMTFIWIYWICRQYNPY